MPEYRVIRQIDLGAEARREAAERAAEILRGLDVRDECSAAVLDVYERRAGVIRRTGERLDLSNESEHRPIGLFVDTLRERMSEIGCRTPR